MNPLDRNYGEEWTCGTWPCSSSKALKMNPLDRNYGEERTCGTWPCSSSEHHRGDYDAKEELDALLAQSMANLSFQERQIGQEELHGVFSGEITEDMDQIQTWLEALDAHLGQFKGGTAYETAETLNSEYVSNRDFRLMFLRANRYDPKSATFHLLRFFETKLQLFGMDKLVQDITLNDLDDDDRACLQNGSRQILQSTDSAKRPVFLEVPGLRSFSSLSTELRARFYMFMSAMKSQEAQIRGIAIILYAVGTYKDTTSGMGYVEHTKLALALPIHFAGLHLCCDDLKQYLMASASIAVMPASIRSRFKVHFGSHVECQYLLFSFGIPREFSLLFSLDGERATMENILLWYRDRYMSEIGGELPEYLKRLPNLPRSNDVLFGKKNNHRGNKIFSQLVEDNSDAYDMASRSRKRELTGEIMHEIQAIGGRFLKQVQNSEVWQESTIDEAHEKIAQGFRNYRRPRVKRVKSDAPISLGGAIVHNPGPNDVLFGRHRSNAGNKLVRQLVSEKSEEYNDGNKAQKRQISDSVMREIKSHGGRFLKQREDLTTWEEVSDDFARNKISKHFSNNRRVQRRLSSF